MKNRQMDRIGPKNFIEKSGPEYLYNDFETTVTFTFSEKVFSEVTWEMLRGRCSALRENPKGCAIVVSRFG
jgi:hypothetical protein